MPQPEHMIWLCGAPPPARVTVRRTVGFPSPSACASKHTASMAVTSQAHTVRRHCCRPLAAVGAAAASRPLSTRPQPTSLGVRRRRPRPVCTLVRTPHARFTPTRDGDVGRKEGRCSCRRGRAAAASTTIGAPSKKRRKRAHTTKRQGDNNSPSFLSSRDASASSAAPRTHRAHRQLRRWVSPWSANLRRGLVPSSRARAVARCASLRGAASGARPRAHGARRCGGGTRLTPPGSLAASALRAVRRRATREPESRAPSRAGGWRRCAAGWLARGRVCAQRSEHAGPGGCH